MISNTQLNTSQNILDEEDFLSNYADDFLFDDITTSDEQQPQNLSNNDEQNTSSSNHHDLVVLLKQAKGRDDQFESVFPPSLLCHPYKYDLKVIGELENTQQAKLTLNLVDAETLTVPNVTLPNKKIVEGVSVEQIEENVTTNERIIRFTFNLCSFHFKRRPFKLELTQVKGSTSKRLFLSNSFQTFARRRDHHQSFNSAKSSDKHQSNSVFTPDSSSNSSNSTVPIQSPKMKKKGVKRSISTVNPTTYYPLNKTRNIAPSSPNSSLGSPTILNPHYAQFPIVYPANIATAVYHPDMAQQFALQYAPKMQMPLFVPQQWATYPTQNPMVFGSPNTSPISPPSNAIPQHEKTTDILGALITGDCSEKKSAMKKDHKIIHHTPLNFVHAMPTAPVMETSERASMAIQFLQSLTPVERKTVSMFMNGGSHTL